MVVQVATAAALDQEALVEEPAVQAVQEAPVEEAMEGPPEVVAAYLAVVLEACQHHPPDQELLPLAASLHRAWTSVFSFQISRMAKFLTSSLSPFQASCGTAEKWIL